MTKAQLFLLLTFAAVLQINSSAIKSNSDNDKKHFHGHLKQFIQRRCLINSSGGQLYKALNELQNIKECFKKKFPTHTAQDNEGLEERCFEQRQQVQLCMKRLTDYLEPCLDKEEKYLPGFIAKAYEGFSDYFCSHINLLTPEKLIGTKIAKCVNTFNKNKDIDPNSVCYEHSKLNDIADTSVTKAELCVDLDKLYNCFQHQFHEYCPDSPKAWEFESGLLNGIRSPCKN